MTKQGKIWGYIDLSTNFSKNTLDKFSDELNPSNQTLIGANVNVYLDTTSKIYLWSTN